MSANTFVTLTQLNPAQLSQYRAAVSVAFPKIISESKVIQNYWSRLEEYFPDFQFFLLSEHGDLIGFMNTIPFEFGQPLQKLPDHGWDWMFSKGVSDYELVKTPAFLGGLQVIVLKKYQKQGYSKTILNHVKKVVKSSALQCIIIPIRPTKKHLHPKMSMTDYINLKENGQAYDPWIKTHLNSGAEILKVCEKSMTITGGINFWNTLLKQPITESGDHFLEGALTPISIDLENNFGSYEEPNIWIKYEL